MWIVNFFKLYYTICIVELLCIVGYSFRFIHQLMYKYTREDIVGKIFCLMGKSSSGKDTIFKHLMEQKALPLQTIVPCTTRPVRQGETHGVEYFFYTEEELSQLEQEGKIIELRAYNTVHGIWKYFTADNGQIDLDNQDYLIIGTLESYVKMQEYFGAEKLIPIYVYVDDGIRLQRALDRERTQEEPKYAEMCRRFLADEQDFSLEKLKAADIQHSFSNENLTNTITEITDFIRKYL